MNPRNLRAILTAIAVIPFASTTNAADIGTAFTYQGFLEKPAGTQVGTPTPVNCDFEFALWDDSAPSSLGIQIGPTLTFAGLDAVEVTDGVFTVVLDFGENAINGQGRWLAIRVCCPSGCTLEPLYPWVELSPAPYALALPGLYTQQNEASPNVIGGYSGNTVSSGVAGATISGGGYAGGQPLDQYNYNRVTDNFGTIGGGFGNLAGDATGLTYSAEFATVGGGLFNTASEESSTVSGGGSNTASGEGSTVGGGIINTTGGYAATVPGGVSNDAHGDYSFAAGRRAEVRSIDNGTFVWADSTDTDFVSSGPNQFLIRASGGVGIGTNAPAAQLDVNGATRTTTLEITGGSPSIQSLVGWGLNDCHQTRGPAGTFTVVAAGFNDSLAIRSDGTLVGWGFNNYGQTDVPTGTFTAVAAGYYHGLAIRSDGTLAGWGDIGSGQTNVPEGTFTAVAAGISHGLAIRGDGTLAQWGGGNGTPPAGAFIAIAVGWSHSLAIRSNGTLAAWGDNGYGQTDVPPGTFVAVAAGAYHSLAIRSDGTLAGWGDNSDGQTEVPGGTFTAVAAAYSYGLAIRSDGTLVGWGQDEDGTLTNIPSGTFTAVAAGFFHSLAITTDQAPPNDPALRLLVDSATKPGSNTWTISSDRRFKKNIEPLSGALERLLQLRGVTFQWLDPASQGGITGTQMGLIADEVSRAFPQWVGRDTKGYQTLTVGGFEALTAEALRELRAEKDRQLQEKDCEIDELREQKDRELAELREKLERFEAMLNALASQNAGGSR